MRPEMYKISTDTKEPVLLKMSSVSDDRGYLIPLTDDINHDLFHRCYIVGDYGKRVVRGLHYHKKEMKIFTIVSGAAKFIAVKIPEDMADRNNHQEIENYLEENPDVIKTFVLSDRHQGVVAIPAYYANGWVSLEDNTILVCLSSLRFEKTKDDDIRIDPYIIGKKHWETIAR